MQSEYDVNTLYQEAQTRWLKPAEVLFILQNHEKYQLTSKAPQNPTSGSLFLFNKRVLKFFRKDGHRWRRKKDGRAIAEAHERLKVGNAEALNCYYAHGENNSSFQRRSYWMLDPGYEHIVLVHYRDVSEAKEGQQSSGHVLEFSPNAHAFFSSPSSLGTQNTSYTEYHQHSLSPGSAETVLMSNAAEDGTCSSDYEVRQALRRLEEQLSLGDDNINSIDMILSQKEDIDNQPTTTTHYRSDNNKLGRCYGGYIGNQDHSNNLMLVKKDSGSTVECGDQEPESWNDVLEACEESLHFNTDETTPCSEILLPEVNEASIWNYGTQVEQPISSFSQEPAAFEVPTYPCFVEARENISDYHRVTRGPIEQNASLNALQKHKFTIEDISPEWGYAFETTKVIIVGSFLCDPTEDTYHCMFGSTEVSAEIIKEGVIRCEAPPFCPGKVALCVSSGNRVSCSQIQEFEYRDKAGTETSDTSTVGDELLLLVRFVQMLLSPDSDSGVIDHMVKRFKDDEKWCHAIGAILDGSATSSSTVRWLLEELLKDKLDSWISSRSRGAYDGSCSLSKKEQGIIHMAAGLGFEWAMSPILSQGVSVNFRDINGWSALHWAARFGREKVVASLIASGASAGAVTDPSSQDPIGKTAASIASWNGHKGLAGYLSEVALTDHLSSLTIEETETSKGSAHLQADITVNSIYSSPGNHKSREDELSLKDTLAAVRNAAQAAARIQAAFRAHSFRKRQQREASAAACFQEYGIYGGDLSAMSKWAHGSGRDYRSAALSIQKKYRGWKGRKDFLALRHKVVKIQAHVRGYQVRKHYKVICWAVGILDKVVLRWRRKGAGLRGFRQGAEEREGEEDEEEDILKVFRKQKVEGAVNEAFSRVLSMTNSPDAQQQYRRMLKRFYEAKGEVGSRVGMGSSGDAHTFILDTSDMEQAEAQPYLLP